MKKWICLTVLALGIGILLLFPNGEEAEKDLHAPAPQLCRVLLNVYAPEDWNGGFGHYDLSFLAPEGMAFRCRLREAYLEGSELTLSYGPTAGDNSPARVNLYPRTRSDHIPRERLVVYEELHMEDFHGFIRWFAGEFADYERTAERHHVFRVMDESFAVYSLAEEKNCLSAALHMLAQLPGVYDRERNPCAGVVDRLERGMG